MSDLRILLASAHLDLSSEPATQDGIERLLGSSGIDYRREVVLGPGDKIDFMVGRTGVEVKLKCSPNALLRQLYRYAAHDEIESLILVTSSPRLAALPAALRGKPLEAIILTGSLF